LSARVFGRILIKTWREANVSDNDIENTNARRKKISNSKITLVDPSGILVNFASVSASGTNAQKQLQTTMHTSNNQENTKKNKQKNAHNRKHKRTQP
jgi:hypothetical protein